MKAGTADELDEFDTDDPTASLAACAAVDRVTTAGLVFETAIGLRRAIEPTLTCLAGPSAPWFEVMIRLARSPGSHLRMADLAAQTSLTPSGLTRAIDRLVELELVARHACAADRRGSYAMLTERGRILMDDAIPRHQALLTQLLAEVFEPEEERAFVASLRKLRDHVNPGAARVPED